ncbi:hypothetical protein M758_4G039700 [Ceratodon purpureus]|nr:hypothetical protein M758_4G039700 [Ceratodon purpureus]
MAGQMAVYGTGDDWSSSEVFYDSTRRTQEAELLSEYPDLPRVTFSTVASFRTECKSHWSGLINGQGCPYKAYIGVTEEDFQAIDSLRESRNCALPRISLLYDRSEGSMVVKFMVGVAHESVGRLFEWTFKRHLSPQVEELLTSTGSARFTSLAGRSKEPDVSWKPISRVPDTEWPSMVVEVGVSESLKMLQADLRFWLRESGGQTKVAILLHINNHLHTILIERWEVCPRIRPSKPGVAYGLSVRATQTILLDAHVQYNGQGLLIPAALVFAGVALPPGVQPGQFVLSARELDNFNNRFWSERGVVQRRLFMCRR